MFFYSAAEIGVPAEVCNSQSIFYRGTSYFKSKLDALNVYAETPCPMSQLLEADSLPALKEKVRQRIQDFDSKEWLDEHVWPYV